jgi:hypothetical protein
MPFGIHPLDYAAPVAGVDRTLVEVVASDEKGCFYAFLLEQVEKTGGIEVGTVVESAGFG